MASTRRSALAAIGGLAIGGGALLGSGAFSETTAERTVEVNVAADDTNLSADVEVDPRVSETAYVAEDGNNYDDTEYTDRYSLLANPDPTIFFGGTGSNELPQNASVTFDDFLYLENDGDEELTFDISEPSDDILTLSSTSVNVQTGNEESIDVTVDTPSEDASGNPDATTAIEITISPI